MESTRRQPRRDSGFSLLEILIAVAILALIGGVVAPNLFGEFFRAKRQITATQLDNIAVAVKNYRLRPPNRLPEQNEFPSCLTEPGPNGEPPLLDTDKLQDGKIVDAWGNEIVYRREGNSFELISYGEDGVQGGEGDAADISTKSGK